MDVSALPECVQRLVRPRLALRVKEESDPSPVIGVWGGHGVVPLSPVWGQRWTEEERAAGRGRFEDREAHHWISVDCSWLERNGFGIRGWMSVYDTPCSDFRVVNDPEPEVVNLGDGLPLVGQEELCFPHEHVLDAYLTDEEKASLAKGYEGLGKDYWKFVQTGWPLSIHDVAVLGGWHIIWPDGQPSLPRLRVVIERLDRAYGNVTAAEVFRCEPYRLVLWTLRDSEPWVEVWGDDTGKLYGVSRIS
jgi:hypothetical protein